MGADRSARESLSNALATAGFHPILGEARDAGDADLDEPWDLVLCAAGCVAPMVARLRKRGLDVPVAAFSAASDEGDASNAFAAGACDFVLTYAPARLASLVTRELEARATRRELRRVARLRVYERVARGIAHDLNSMFTVAQALSKELHEDSESPLTADLVSVMKRAGALCSQFVRFDLPAPGQQAIIELAEMIRQLAPMLSAFARNTVELELVLKDDIELIKAERGQIEQVIMNLVINARDALPSGGRITVETDECTLDDAAAISCFPPLMPGRYVVLRVRDTGTGMDETTRERIFEPFFTTKAEGNGIGLATVADVVAELDGGMRVRSRVGKGTTFEILLPGAGPKPRSDVTRREPRSVRGQGELVLVVEDDPMFRRALRRNLEAAGYSVFDVARAREALQLCEKYPVAAVVTDLAMPGMSGQELVARLVYEHDVGVVVLSGFPEPHSLPEGVVYLDKPAYQHQLLPTLRDIIERRGSGAPESESSATSA
ncbi:MAG TPA: ATP-binding protein [Polyangiaceae bacterium]|nr:ATP-binding protein [Polyangiaceae bacterium]